MAPLIAVLRSRFYCDEAVILDAIRRRSSFNLIDEHSFVKVDVFVPPAGPMGEGQLIRRQRYQLAGSSPVYVLSAEDDRRANGRELIIHVDSASPWGSDTNRRSTMSRRQTGYLRCEPGASSVFEE